MMSVAGLVMREPRGYKLSRTSFRAHGKERRCRCTALMIQRTRAFLAPAGWSLILLCTSMPVHAREIHPGCAQHLFEMARRTTSVAPYAARAGGYCDGEAPSLHAGRLELQSLTDGPVQFVGAKLEVSVKAKGDYWLRGRDLRPRGKYRLDGPLPGGLLEIDLRDAVLPLKLPQDKLGMYAFKRDEGRIFHAPVSSGHSGEMIAIFHYPGRLASVVSATLCREQETGCTLTGVVDPRAS